MANLASAIILLLFFWGRSLWRQNLTLHIAIMSSVMVADFALVIALVVFKDALTKVSPVMPWTLMIHVPIALSTLALYTLTAFSAFKLFKGQESYRKHLRFFDRGLVVARVLTLVTSLMVEFIPVV